jgi:hypothetical protein
VTVNLHHGQAALKRHLEMWDKERRWPRNLERRALGASIMGYQNQLMYAKNVQLRARPSATKQNSHGLIAI